MAALRRSALRSVVVIARFEFLSSEQIAAALAAPRRPVLVDVRDRAEFECGRIPGSVHAPVHDLGRLRSRLPGSLAERLIVIGDERVPTIAAGNFLVLLGFGDVSALDGGISAWTGPIDRSPPGEDGPARGPQLRVVPDEPPSPAPSG